MNASQLQNHFDAFYEDFWCEMCKYGEIEEVVVCDNNNDRKSLIHPQLDIEAFLTCQMNRPHRKRLRALQIRRRRAKSLRRPQLALVCRPPYLLRALTSHRLPRSMLSPQQRRGLRPRRLLQLHTSKATESGAGSRFGHVDEKVVEDEREG
jgi:hypothetical protein